MLFDTCCIQSDIHKITGENGQVLAAKSKDRLYGIGRFRSVERPFYPPPDIGVSLITSPDHDLRVTRLRLSATRSICIPNEDWLFPFSTAEQEMFYDFAVPVFKRSESRLQELALQGPVSSHSKPFGVVQIRRSQTGQMFDNSWESLCWPWGFNDTNNGG